MPNICPIFHLLLTTGWDAYTLPIDCITSIFLGYYQKEVERGDNYVVLLLKNILEPMIMERISFCDTEIKHINLSSGSRLRHKEIR